MSAYSVVKDRLFCQRVSPADDLSLADFEPIFYGAVRRVYPARFAGSEYLLQGSQFRNGCVEPCHCVRLCLSQYEVVQADSEKRGNIYQNFEGTSVLSLFNLCQMVEAQIQLIRQLFLGHAPALAKLTDAAADILNLVIHKKALSRPSRKRAFKISA